MAPFDAIFDHLEEVDLPKSVWEYAFKPLSAKFRLLDCDFRQPVYTIESESSGLSGEKIAGFCELMCYPCHASKQMFVRWWLQEKGLQMHSSFGWTCTLMGGKPCRRPRF